MKNEFNIKKELEESMGCISLILIVIIPAIMFVLMLNETISYEALGICTNIFVVSIVIGCILGVPSIIRYQKELEEAKKRQEKEKERKEKLSEQIAQEREQKELAHTEGLEKYHKIELENARKHQRHVDALRTIGALAQQSVYQEQKKDWAVLGGIAEGISGTAAGIVTALDTMKENERIEAENAAWREWGAQKNAHFQSLAAQAAWNSPTVLTMPLLQRKYEAIMSWHPITLLSLITIESVSTHIHYPTDAVTVRVKWSQKDRSICVDGALRAKLYTSTGKCAGCAYLVLPIKGTSTCTEETSIGFKGTLSGICAEPLPSTQYTVKIEPVDLWELARREDKTSRNTDNLTLDEHRKIVSDYENKYQSEIANN